jgi:enamine deaminase RidA (YjgF/YER057c/UK114 family)
MRKLLFVFLALAVSACFAQKQAINPKAIPTSPNFSNAILKDGTLYLSGQVGRGPDGKRPEAFEDEVKAALDSIGVILKEAGMGFENAVAVQVYLTDMDLFPKMNSVYVTVFPEPRPSRTTVGVAKLVGNFRIEITVTAKK